MEKLFYSTDKGMSDEDWYFLVVDMKTNSISIEHKWSHKQSGSLTFKEGQKSYSLEEFKQNMPNQHQKLLEKLLTWLQVID